MNVAKNARVITEALLFVVTIFRTTPAFKLQIKLNIKCFQLLMLLLLLQFDDGDERAKVTV